MISGKNTALSNNINCRNERTPINISEEDFIFDSRFESGNLDLVVKKSQFEYDLYMRSDSNANRNSQWFYFSVFNKIKGKVQFNIQNFSNQFSLFEKGMRIAIFSTKKEILAKERKVGIDFLTWHKGGLNIKYKSSNLSSFYLNRFGIKSNNIVKNSLA